MIKNVNFRDLLRNPELLFCRWKQLAVLITFLTCLGFLATGLYFNVEGQVVPPYLDTTIYMQYARAIAEGHPYRFQAWDQPTTGSTSHLYPFFLAIPYLLGMKGDALATAAALMGIAAFVMFLLLFVRIGRAIAPRALPLALLMTVLSGHVVINFFGQNDMLLFMVLIALAVMAYLEGRFVLLCITLPLLPLTRPDGILLVAAFIVCEGMRLWLKPGKADLKKWIIPSVSGIFGIGMMYAINLIVTGHAGFDSISNKGYFYAYPLAGALVKTLSDFSQLVHTLIFGVSEGSLRELFVFPVLGGLLLFTGLLLRRWYVGRRTTVWLWLLSAGAAQMLFISTSSWMGIHYDRYFVWQMPFIYLLISCGVERLCRKLDLSLRRRVFGLLACLLLAYQFISLISIWGYFSEQCRVMCEQIKFVKQVDREIADDKTIGFCGIGGLSYYMPGKKCENLYGIVSSRFNRQNSTTETFEIFKHEPELRPDFICRSNKFEDWLPILRKAEYESGDLLGTEDVLKLHTPVWQFLDRAKSGIQNTNIINQLQGLKQTGHLDIGYDKQESQYAYGNQLRLSSVFVFPFWTVAEIADSGLAGPVLEVGKAVIGYESFTVPTAAGQPLTLVLRSGSQAKTAVTTCSGQSVNQNIQMGGYSVIRIIAGGITFDTKVKLHQSENFMTEIMITIPADAVTGEKTEVVVGGDHISYAYWFFQPEGPE